MESKQVFENVSGSQVYVKILDPRGREESKHVRPGQTVALTDEERRINEFAAVSPKYNMFENGMLVQLLDDKSGVEVASNPNAIAESELEDLFKLTAAKFKTRIADINSYAVVRRLLEVARGEDSPASVSQVKVLEARFEDLDERPKSLRTEAAKADKDGIAETHLDR